MTLKLDQDPQEVGQLVGHSVQSISSALDKAMQASEHPGLTRLDE